jgi:hypothetical protein
MTTPVINTTGTAHSDTPANEKVAHNTVVYVIGWLRNTGQVITGSQQVTTIFSEKSILYFTSVQIFTPKISYRN